MLLNSSILSQALSFLQASLTSFEKKSKNVKLFSPKSASQFLSHCFIDLTVFSGNTHCIQHIMNTPASCKLRYLVLLNCMELTSNWNALQRNTAACSWTLQDFHEISRSLLSATQVNEQYRTHKEFSLHCMCRYMHSWEAIQQVNHISADRGKKNWNLFS